MGQTAGTDQGSLWPLLAKLKARRWVDLTHSFSTDTPHSPNFQPAEFKVIYRYDDQINGRRAGFLSHEYRFAGQWGTHVDPPMHFREGMRSQDEIPVDEMALPLVVIDISQKVAVDPDYCVALADIAAWEGRHGPVPAGAFVALRTDWSRRWPDQEQMMNRDAAGVCHYPGWSLEVLKLLYERRGITASGHETTDTDPGLAASRNDGSLEDYILANDHWQIEVMANLGEVPEAGSIIVVSWPKAEKGSGFPARAFAILPGPRGGRDAFRPRRPERAGSQERA